jgi:hypothetical protein
MKQIWTPAGTVPVFFPSSAEKLLSFGGSATISVAGIFEISGTDSGDKDRIRSDFC